jgi:hypothetical protein
MKFIHDVFQWFSSHSQLANHQKLGRRLGTGLQNPHGKFKDFG